MKTFRLRILGAERTFYDGPCQSLTVPTIDGRYGLMAQHENVVIAIIPGELTLYTESGEEQIAAARAEAEEAAADREKKLTADLAKAKKALEKALDGKKAAEARAEDAERERTSAMDAAKSYKAEAETAAKRAAMAANEGLTRFKVVFDQTVANVNKLAELLTALPDGEQEKLRRALGALADQVRRVSA